MDDDTKILNAVNPPQHVHYVRERPFLKFGIGSIVVLLGLIAFLWLTGFIMGATGHRPPAQPDLRGQWESVTKGKPTSYGDCMEKGGVVTQSMPPTCTFAGVTITRPMVEVCTLSPELAECQPTPLSDPARAAGEELGKKYNNFKKDGKSFIDGFKEETTVDETLKSWTDDAKKALTPPSN